MKGSTKRILSLLVTGALMVLALVVYGTMIKPEYAVIQNLRAEVGLKTSTYEDQSAAITKVQDLIAANQNKAQLQQRVSLILPPKEGVADIMSQLQAIAQATGVSIQAVNLEYLPIQQLKEDSALTKGLGSLRLNLKLFGSYATFKKFVEGMETNIRVMDLTTLRIEHAGRSDQDLYTYTLTINTYYQTN